MIGFLISNNDLLTNLSTIYMYTCRHLQREQIVIVEFAGLIPQSSLVTFNFYHYATGKKLSTVPIVPLGPHTAKAKFPGRLYAHAAC